MLRRDAEPIPVTPEGKSFTTEELLKHFLDRNLSLWGHGTDPELIDQIMVEGLVMKNPSLYAYTNRIIDPVRFRESPTWRTIEARHLFEDWPGSRIYPFTKIVLIAIATKEGDRGQNDLYDEVIERLEKPKVISGDQYPYVVSPKYIAGYIDIGNFRENLHVDFVPNPTFGQKEP